MAHFDIVEVHDKNIPYDKPLYCLEKLDFQKLRNIIKDSSELRFCFSPGNLFLYKDEQTKDFQPLLVSAGNNIYSSPNYLKFEDIMHSMECGGECEMILFVDMGSVHLRVSNRKIRQTPVIRSDHWVDYLHGLLNGHLSSSNKKTRDQIGDYLDHMTDLYEDFNPSKSRIGFVIPHDCSDPRRVFQVAPRDFDEFFVPKKDKEKMLIKDYPHKKPRVDLGEDLQKRKDTKMNNGFDFQSFMMLKMMDKGEFKMDDPMLMMMMMQNGGDNQFDIDLGDFMSGLTMEQIMMVGLIAKLRAPAIFKAKAISKLFPNLDAQGRSLIAEGKYNEFKSYYAMQKDAETDSEEK